MAAPVSAHPLYDARFEHDACGVGFVAATRRSDRGRVLGLALAGLANLSHRGAFAADGESSDGAGVALPLGAALLRRTFPSAAGRPAVAMLFLPTRPATRRRARGMVEAALASEGLAVAAWRDVPIDAHQLGGVARLSMPHIVQALIPRRGNGRAFERRLLLARRRMEIAADEAGLADFAVASCSSRTVVYKGLVAGSRLGAFYADLAPDRLPLSHAVFHQRYATNTTPRWPLAQPFRLIAHNGEINTVRGNREELRGRMARLGGELGRRLSQLGPLLTAEGSDSLSLDEALDMLTAAGWPLPSALLLAIPEALALRSEPLDELDEFRRRVGGLLAPWDGPAALAFSDGRRVGAMLDRNGLRPASVTITHGGLVAVASEAGAVPISAAETAHRRRLGPGEMIVVEPARRAILDDRAAKLAAAHAVLGGGQAGGPRRSRLAVIGGPAAGEPVAGATHAEDAPGAAQRWIHGLDAERQRLDLRTMALEAHEPLWSMGDDTPTAALGRLDRRTADHLRQAFAQVTNPAIDPERERIVMSLAVELGRRRPLLAGPRAGGPPTLRLPSPVLADVAPVRRAFPGRRLRVLDATWTARDGAPGLRTSLDRLARQAVAAARGGCHVLLVSDRRASGRRLPVPSVLAIGAVHTALSDAGLRGQADIVAEAGDVLDVHAAAMALACGARAVAPWLAVQVAAEMAGGRGAEQLTAEQAVGNLVDGLEKGLRKVLARMGISAVASYVGSQLFDTLELSDEVASRCFPAAPAWSGPVGFEAIARRQLRRLASAPIDGAGERLPDPGFVRFRADGEQHLYAPSFVRAAQALAESTGDLDDALADYRFALARSPAVIRDQLVIRRARRPIPLDEVEPAEQVMSRFVGAAMSLGALSPEAHQALTVGLRRVGAASNTGEGGEDPAWYVERDGLRHDSAIKQVASARFGVTATYLARAEQLEIKIAQGSKPGEGGQLPSRKVTPLIAALRRAQPGQSLISPPPHHDIYSIEDLAQLIADLRTINPGARIGVKLVASLGVGTIAAGVAKAGADYVQVSGHSGGTGASPLSSIKHVGIPWELGLAETHQVLLRNELRERVALRTDGGLQSGRDVVVAAMLGAEEFGFGTAALVALGCDMARQCHLDTCPTGIATQREDLRAKFGGTPEHVERFFRAIAHDVRRELAAAGARSLGEVIGANRMLAPARGVGHTVDVRRLLSAPSWSARAERRADPASARFVVEREPASTTEQRLVTGYAHLPRVVADPLVGDLEHAETAIDEGAEAPVAELSTADRSFGARVSGMAELGVVRRRVSWRLVGTAGQSFGAFAGPSVALELRGQANDYVGKGLSGGTLVLRPEDELLERASELAICGNTCLYGATAGRLHIVGRAGMRFGVRNSGAQAVVEGIGAHGCEYMTGGVVVILGPVGHNLCAGMTGGRVHLWDPAGDRATALDRASARASRLAHVMAERDDGADIVDELRLLLEQHRAAGSLLARRLLENRGMLGEEFWLIEPVDASVAARVESVTDVRPIDVRPHRTPTAPI